MTKNLTNSVLLALALFGGAALVAEPAFAGSYRHGHSGWNKNAQNYSVPQAFLRPLLRVQHLWGPPLW